MYHIRSSHFQKKIIEHIQAKWESGENRETQRMRKHKREVRIKEKKSGKQHNADIRFQRKHEKQRNPMRKSKHVVRMREKNQEKVKTASSIRELLTT